MPPRLCFFKDFDSFTLEPDYLEIVYGTKPFRFGYATNSEDRTFSIKSLGKSQITLPEMLLECQDKTGFHAVYLVDLYAEFEDALKFGDFVGKLARVAGYHQVKLPNCELSANNTSNSDEDDENEDELDEANSHENIFNQHQNLEFIFERKMPLPTVQFVEGQPLRYNFAAGYLEVYHPETRQTWRFLHAANRQYQVNPTGHPPKKNRCRYFLLNVVLQVEHSNPGRRCPPYFDVGECDVEFDLPSTTAMNLTDHFTANRYTAILG